MKLLLALLGASWSWLWLTPLQAQTEPSEDWDLVAAYNASTHVFYGEVSKILPEPNYKTGVVGVRLRDIDENDMPMEELVWRDAKEITFAVSEYFKQATPIEFRAYLPDPDLTIWTQVMNEAGDVFLAKPEIPEEALRQLNPGDRALFFIRYYLGSDIPVLYKVRFGRFATNDLALLQLHRAAGRAPLESIVAQAERQKKAIEAREAAEFRVFEDEYYKILRIQDLEIRRSLLNDLTERMGVEGLWTYFEYKERYLKDYGSPGEELEVPSPPNGSKEKLWQDISAELKKIEVVLKARQN